MIKLKKSDAAAGSHAPTSDIALSAIVLALIMGLLATIMLSFALMLAHPKDAEAVTAAEKRAEADTVYARIDSLQTSLNEATRKYENATAAHDEATALRDEAAAQIEVETARIETLQADLSSFAVGIFLFKEH